MTYEELEKVIGFDGPWDPDGARSGGWTFGTCRHVGNLAVAIDLPSIDDVVSVHSYASTDDEDWDGATAAILVLTDGRWMTWESWWGPTGSGFSDDAYGGDADVWIADSLDASIRLGLTNDGRRLLGVDQ